MLVCLRLSKSFASIPEDFPFVIGLAQKVVFQSA
jgi:hypothetical protein